MRTTGGVCVCVCVCVVLVYESENPESAILVERS